MERICPQCGYVNRAAGIFCAQCGTRMTGLPQPDAPRRRRFNPLSFLFGLIKWAITLAVIAFLVGLLWPPPTPEPVNDPARADVFEQAMERLLEAADARRAAAEIVTEHDINAYLSRQLSLVDQGDASSGMRVALRQIRVELKKNRVRMTADTAYGPVRIVMAVAGTPVVTDGGFSLRLDETRVGRIPFPVAYGGWIAEKVRSTVAGLQRESDVLRQITRIEVEDGKATLLVSGQ